LPYGVTLAKVTTYCTLVIVLLAAAGCNRRMTTTKARLVQPQPAADQSAPKALSPQSEECFDNGLSLFRAGRDEAAVDFFVRAVVADSSNWKAHYYLALVHKKHAAQRAALASLHAALTFAPDQRRDRSMIYLALGELFEQLEDFSRAQLSYRTALNLYPGSDRALAGLNRVEQLTQQLEK